MGSTWNVPESGALVSRVAGRRACQGFQPHDKAAARLPSWNDGPRPRLPSPTLSPRAREGSPDYVAPGDRIAVFDNYGTFWSEQPVYFQLAFALDRVKALAPKHPEWKEKRPFKAVIEGDIKKAGLVGASGR